MTTLAQRTTHKADAPAHGPSALFDLHSTAMRFALLAVFLVLLRLAGHVVVGAVERWPVWAVALCLLAVFGFLAVRRRQRRLSVALVARETATALDRG